MLLLAGLWRARLLATHPCDTQILNGRNLVAPKHEFAVLQRGQPRLAPTEHFRAELHGGQW